MDGPPIRRRGSTGFCVDFGGSAVVVKELKLLRLQKLSVGLIGFHLIYLILVVYCGKQLKSIPVIIPHQINHASEIIGPLNKWLVLAKCRRGMNILTIIFVL